MRSVAPESAGAAASQNSWSVVYLNPSAFRFTATTLQSCQTAKARKSAGTEIQRLRRAMASPCWTQNALSSGFQMSRMRPLGAVATEFMFALLSSNGFDSVGEAERAGVRADHLGAAHLSPVHPDERYPDDPVHQHEAARPDSGEVEQHAEHDRQQETSHAAGQADDARDYADVVMELVPDVLEHRGLAEGPGDSHQ